MFIVLCLPLGSFFEIGCVVLLPTTRIFDDRDLLHGVVSFGIIMPISSLENFLNPVCAAPNCS